MDTPMWGVDIPKLGKMFGSGVLHANFTISRCHFIAPAEQKFSK